MAQPMLLHKPSGILYVWQEAFAQRDDFEEVIDVETREVHREELAQQAKARKPRKPAPAVIDVEALSADASRNLP